ncbi:hypothetical protein CRUP_022108 [Coryphaenoides rupestris]|nr:hypothetical protein CRUP_022108 [Coryphaenoides rupestris]
MQAEWQLGVDDSAGGSADGHLLSGVHLVEEVGGVVHGGGCLGLRRTGLLLLLVLGGAPVIHGATTTGGHVPRAAELEQDEGDQH